MATTKEKETTITRVEIKADQEFMQILDLLAQDEGLTKPQVLKKAVGLMARLRVLQKEGKTLLIGNIDGTMINVERVLQF